MLRRLAVLLLIAVSLPLAAKNRLANEKSPYLRDHAGNLVDWLPWSAAAFERAKKEGKPVFLSIGYASCHWCHVMSRESFDDAEIAKLLNEHFVPILVDRQEHPDVDASYISFVEATTGSAGWPLNLILLPDQQPVTGTSYLKPEQLKKLLQTISTRWTTDRKAITSPLSMVASMIEQPSPADVAAKETIAHAVEDMQRSFDAKHGGFGGAPKFPLPLTLDLLLRSGNRDMALATLRAMAKGAIHDRIDGGFHRYTVDAAWNEPHYEKMLSDQALLAIDYLEAWQLTGDASFKAVALDTLDYLLTLRQPNGGFAAGQDADSLSGGKLVEGAYYRGDRKKLAKPALDTKVITGWNGLAISALARAGAAFGEPRYIKAALDASKLLRKPALMRVDGVDALCEDYAFSIAALIDLFEATGDVSLLDSALALQKKQDELFWNKTKYGNGSAMPQSLAKLAVEAESDLPTANSISAANLLRLGEFTDSDALRKRAGSIIRAYGSRLASAPAELPAMVAALTMMTSAPRQIVIAGNAERDDTRALLRIAHEHFSPFRIIAPNFDAKLAEFMPITKEMKPIGGKATAFVCQHYVCKLPTTDPSELKKSLETP